MGVAAAFRVRAQHGAVPVSRRAWTALGCFATGMSLLSLASLLRGSLSLVQGVGLCSAAVAAFAIGMLIALVSHER